MFKELKKTMSKELKLGMALVSQTENINKRIEIIKRNK